MVAYERAGLVTPDALDRMGRLLRHRGPDGSAVVRAPDAALGVQRLRVVDPRPQSDQPFVDPSSGVWLACNGEIYNAPALRGRYPDYPYRSRSDVEPLLPLFLNRGALGLTGLDGMFALAIWDPRTRHLVLARDRAGEKPLFYLHLGGEIWFASEIQALLEHPALTRDIDTRALSDFLAVGYVREPRTMFSRVRKVQAGTIVSCTPQGVRVLRYWDPDAVPTASMPHDIAAQQLSELIENAVARQGAVSPIGVFTSGGVDSALLVALAARTARSNALYTFTVGFDDPDYDERGPAAEIAARVGTRHVEVRADGAGLRDALDIVTQRVAEPLADPAILPTYLLARAAREHVSVVLSGEGADELFGGYPTYLGHRFAPLYRSLPTTTQRAIRRLVAALPMSTGKVPLEYLLKRFVAASDHDWLDRHVKWFGTGLDPRVNLCRAPVGFPAVCDHNADSVAQAMRFDYRTYLRDGLLTKMDRATMLASIEARAPYLDRALTEFALGLHWSLKIHGITTKWILKQAASAWLPRAITRRKKRGLSVPVAAWLNDGLRQEVDRLLAPARLRRAGVLDPGIVQRLVSEHRSGCANHARALWTLMVFELWRERWLGG